MPPVFRRHNSLGLPLGASLFLDTRSLHALQCVARNRCRIRLDIRSVGISYYLVHWDCDGLGDS